MSKSKVSKGNQIFLTTEGKLWPYMIVQYNQIQQNQHHDFIIVPRSLQNVTCMTLFNIQLYPKDKHGNVSLAKQSNRG